MSLIAYVLSPTSKAHVKNNRKLRE